MSVPCVIASYVLCDVVFFVVILCLLLILAKNENKKKELSVFLPLSRLFMIALLAMTFCWTGVPSAGYERIAVFVVVSLGMLLPLIVGPALKKVAGEISSSVDIACVGLFAALGFLSINMGFGDGSWSVALQVALPAASTAGAVSVLLIKHAKGEKKGR